MAKLKQHLFSISFLVITIVTAAYAMYLGDDILPDGTVVETGRMMMPLLIIAFVCFLISLVVEHFRNKRTH